MVGLGDVRRILADILYGAAYGRHLHELRKESAALHDLFMLLCYLEVMGVPNPAVLLRHYVQGDSAIEAYWKSVAWPAQGLFIGEPLAAPYARR